MKNLSYLLLALSLAAFWSCDAVGGGVSNLLPPSTIGFVQVNSPDTLLEDANAMVGQLGLGQFLDGMTVKETLDAFLVSSGTDITSADFDLSKASGVAALAGPTPGDDPVARVFLASTNPQKVQEAFASIAPPESGMTASIIDGYFVVDVNGTPGETGSFDSSLIKTSSDGTISYYFDFKQFAAASGMEVESLVGMFKSGMSEAADVGLTGLQAAQFNAVMESIGQGIEDFFGLYGALTINQEKIGFSMDIAFVPESSTIENIKKLESESNAREMMKYLASDAVFNLAIAMNSDSMADFNAVLGVSEEMFSEPALYETFNALLNQAYEVIGDNSAISLDMNLTESVIAFFSSPDPSPEGIQRLIQDLAIEFYTVSKITDDALFAEYLDSMFQSEEYTRALNDILATASEDSALFPKLSIGFDVSDNPLNLDFYNKEVKVNIGFEDGGEFDGMEEFSSLVGSILNELTIHYAVKDGLSVVTFGSPDKIKEILVDGAISEGTLADMAGMQTILANAPDQLSSVGNFSLKLLVEGFALGSGGMIPIPYTPGTNPGFAGYTSFGESSIQGALYLTYQEVASVVTPLMPLLMMGSALGL